MKKFFLFFIILLLPSIAAIFVLSHYFPQDTKFFTDVVKEKLVKIYPWLNKYLHVVNKEVVKKEGPPPVKEKPIISNLHHFTNAEIYAPICGKDITEKFSELFVGCNYCPKYLNSESREKNFEYFSETRGKFLKKDEEESLIFMKGCSNKDKNGMAIILRKGYGGWQRQSVFQGVTFDRPPLEYQDSDDFFIFIARKTTINNNYIRQELVRVRIKDKELDQRILFSVDMVRGKKCDKELQASFENPVKKNDESFKTYLEIVGCHKTKLAGSYKIIFNLKDGDFFPDKKTASLMTKIEKHGELR